MLGEPLLRWHAKPAKGVAATVPLFVDGRGGRWMDSMAIIEHADTLGARPLITDLSATRALAAKIDKVLHGVRGRVTSRIVADPEALRESATAAVPAWMAGLASPVAALGARFIAMKHNVSLDQARESTAALRALLTELAPTVDTDAPHTRESLTAGDILLATLLQTVEPVVAAHIALGPALRRAWSERELADEFAGLVAWRDAVYRAAR